MPGFCHVRAWPAQERTLPARPFRLELSLGVRSCEEPDYHHERAHRDGRLRGYLRDVDGALLGCRYLHGTEVDTGGVGAVRDALDDEPSDAEGEDDQADENGAVHADLPLGNAA